MSKIILKNDWDNFVIDYNLDFNRERKFNTWITKTKKNNVDNLLYETIEAFWEEFDAEK